MTANSQGTIDSLDFDIVFEHDTQPGPKVTFYIATDPTGMQADKSATTLKSQLKQAFSALTEAGMSESDVATLLDPVAQILPDQPYWKAQSRGLVIFAAQGFHHAVRIPLEVEESVVVAGHFHVIPLVPILASQGKCYIVALAKNSVRLFDATRNSIEELPLGEIPASFDDVVGETPDQSLQFRQVGGGDIAYHGQGGASDSEPVLTEKFIHAVGKAVGTELGTARSQPLVLASVAEYLPIFRDACPYPAIHGEAIAGNPENTLPDELRSAAWKLLNEGRVERDNAEWERALSLVHNGKGSLDLVEIARAAEEGRIEALYLPHGEQRLDSDTDFQLADRALIGTIHASGAVRTLSDWNGEHAAMAVFRY